MGLGGQLGREGFSLSPGPGELAPKVLTVPCPYTLLSHVALRQTPGQSSWAICEHGGLLFQRRKRTSMCFGDLELDPDVSLKEY